jgi:surface antigen
MRIEMLVIVGLVSSAFAAPSSAQAQFGGLFGSKSSSSEPAKKGGCSDKPRKNDVGRQFLGNMMGSLTGKVTSKMGVAGSWVPSASVAGILTDAIACRLDPGEQKQAADATLQATRGETVGSTATWKSETRPGVTGTSTVVARSEGPSGGACMTVSDVIIVGGEETTVSKRMCRVPPATGYSIAQA